jgi:hypothetical protein
MATLYVAVEEHENSGLKKSKTERKKEIKNERRTVHK